MMRCLAKWLNCYWTSRLLACHVVCWVICIHQTVNPASIGFAESFKVFDKDKSPVVYSSPNLSLNYIFESYSFCQLTALQLLRRFFALGTLLHLVFNGVVASLPDLGLEVEIDKLALLGSPITVGIAVVDDLVASGIADFNGGVGESSLSRPRDGIAASFGDEERLGAADVAITVETFLDGVVEDLALGNTVSV